MKTLFKYRLLLGILFVVGVAVFMRFYQLTKNPVSYSMDEVAFGYNAYSVLKTGHDEHGEFLPLAFKSVGDYKPPVDVYVMVPFVAAFGLSEISVRFPLALYGVLTVIAVIFLIKRLGFRWRSALFAGFWLSVLPWHVDFSRSGVGASGSLFFLVFGILMFLYWIIRLENKWFAFFSAVSFSLSVWGYHAERVFIPLLVIFLFLFLDWKKIFTDKKYKASLWVFVLTVALFAIPFLKLTFFSTAIAERAASTSILRESSLIQSLHQGLYTNIAQRILDNDVFIIFRHWVGKYLNYFDFRFWFLKGLQFTPPGYPDMGLMYAVDLPLFLYGIYSLVRSKNTFAKKLALFWFFAGPLSASFTMNEQHPLRALTWLPFFVIIMAASAENIFGRTKKIWFGFVYLILLVFSVFYFGDIYLNQFPYFYSESWQYGYKQIAVYACDHLNDYDKILVSDTFGSTGPINTGTPPLYFLFYCPTDRNYYLVNGKHLDKILFTRPNVYSTTIPGKLLLIGSTWDFLDEKLYGGKIIKKIVYPSGVDAFWFVERPAKR